MRSRLLYHSATFPSNIYFHCSTLSPCISCNNLLWKMNAGDILKSWISWKFGLLSTCIDKYYPTTCSPICSVPSRYVGPDLQIWNMGSGRDLGAIPIRFGRKPMRIYIATIIVIVETWETLITALQESNVNVVMYTWFASTYLYAAGIRCKPKDGPRQALAAASYVHELALCWKWTAQVQIMLHH